MSAVCYCGREECSASELDARLCLQSALAQLDAERAAHLETRREVERLLAGIAALKMMNEEAIKAEKARLRDVAERQREADARSVEDGDHCRCDMLDSDAQCGHCIGKAAAEIVRAAPLVTEEK